MNIFRSKKGFMLEVSVIFSIILIVSLSVYKSTLYSFKEVRVRDMEYTKAYYANVAALRYAAILLKEPGKLFSPSDPSNYDPDSPENTTYTVTFNENGANLMNDLGLSSDKITMTITLDNTQTPEKYNITASYTV